MQHPLAPGLEGQWSLIHRKVYKELIPLLGLEGSGLYALLSAIAGDDYACVVDKPVLVFDSGQKPAMLKHLLDGLAKHRVITLTETPTSYHIALTWKPRPLPDNQLQKKFIPSRYYSNGQTTEKYKKSNETNGFYYQISKVMHSLNNPMYTQEQIQIANEIADALDDRKAMRLHLSYAKKVPHAVLREFLAVTLARPAHKIWKSRAAYYTSLVEQYLNEGNDYP